MTLRSVRHGLETVLAWTFFWILKRLSIDHASAFGGWVGRRIGRLLPVTNVARRNLDRVFPDLPVQERERIITGMWDNLGRTAGEFPHLGDLQLGEHIELEGYEYIEPFQQSGEPCLFVTAHFGNWELTALTGILLGFKPLTVIYRSASNTGVEGMYRAAREAMGVSLIPKGAEGGRLAVKVLKSGGHLGMLVDQKMNEGISVPFLGIPAMTAPALAVFALKFNLRPIPVHAVRTKGARFKVVFQPPLELPQEGDRDERIYEIMTRVNAIYGDWIREKPEQWFWLHNRWPDDSRTKRS